MYTYNKGKKDDSVFNLKQSEIKQEAGLGQFNTKIPLLNLVQ